MINLLSMRRILNLLQRARVYNISHFESVDNYIHDDPGAYDDSHTNDYPQKLFVELLDPVRIALG